MRAFAALVCAALCLVVFGGIPASVALRPLLLERSAPPVPPRVGDRDAVVVVSATTEDGRPVPAARVHVLAMRTEGDAPAPRAYAAGEASTDRDGRARIERVPRGETWVIAEAEGRARASTHVVLDAGERAVSFTLGAEHRIDVEVRDDRDAPLAGAEVEIVEGDPLPIGARAGPDGVAHARRLGAPPWSLTARAPGYEEVTVRGVKEGAPLRVVLRRLGALLVRVEDESGAAVARARVAIASPALWPARVAETDAHGDVRIGSLAAGTYALRATDATRASPIELGVALDRGEEKHVVLRLGPGVTIALRVASDDGAPVEGARVTFAESGISPFPLEATTDARGRAHLGPAARGPASIVVRADGYVPAEIAVPDPPPAELPITLARAGAVEGRVVDGRGFPIAGATIELVGTAFDGSPVDDDPRRARFTEAHFAAALAGPRPLVAAGDLGVMPGPVPPIPPAGALVAGAPPSVASDEPWVSREDGTYRASPASPGRIRALVHHPQYVDATSDVVSLASGGVAHVDVVLHGGGAVEGRVVDPAGHPVDGARVLLAAVHGPLERVARTASDGTFGFAAVPSDVVLYASPDDDGSPPETRVPAHVPEGGHVTVTLALPPERDPLPARVRDDRGYPIDDAQLTASSLDPANALRETTFTDDRGETKLANARGLPLRVEVTAPGHAPTAVHVDPGAELVDVTLPLAERLEGRVRSARGEPIADAEVALFTSAGTRRTRTDGDGAFTFGEVSPGPVRVTARADGFAPSTREATVEANGGRRPTSLDAIDLARGGVVEGVVLDARGDPVLGARVAQDFVPTYMPVGRSTAGVAVTDARGAFRLPDLPEGDVTIEAFAAESGRAHTSARVVAGETTRDARITLEGAEGPHAHETSAGSLAVTLAETGDPPRIVVVGVAEGSAAERAGLVPGDAVESIDGSPVTTMEEARAKMSGPLADDVVLTLARSTGEVTLRVAREPVRR